MKTQTKGPWVDRSIKLVGHVVWLFLATVAGMNIGYSKGMADGQQRGVDAVLCTMDRIAKSKPVGALGKSKFCLRIYNDTSAK